MELRQLKYFVEVGRLRSFSLASKSLFITQSTISQQIQKLEEELGVELLIRDTRHVTLSDYGEQFYPFASQVLEEARAGAERIRDVKALKVGSLSVGATYSFGPLFKRTVLDYNRQFPNIRLNLLIASKEELRQKLLDRELDLALTYKSTIGDDRIESHLLFPSRLCLVGREGELKGVGSERVKILFDIYHMHRMEGDVINNIRRAYDCIGHFHTAGNPGRQDLDDQQELYYPAIMRAIKALGFKGYVAHEFSPKHGLDSLYEAIKLSDV